VEAERERRPCEWLRKYAASARTGAVRSRRVSSCVGRGCSTREQENPEVRGGIGIANQAGFIVSSQGSTTSSSSYSSSIAEQDHKSPRGLSLRPFSTHYNPQQTSSSPTESRHRRVLLVANPIHRGNSVSACSPS
jgi:hypothetical protein